MKVEFILEMGTQVRIDTMARNFIRLCGKEPDSEIPIKYVGLRPGEKLYEELITEGEGILRTEHEKIMVLGCQGSEMQHLRPVLDKLQSAATRYDAQSIKDALQEAIPEYAPKNDKAIFKGFWN